MYMYMHGTYLYIHVLDCSNLESAKGLGTIMPPTQGALLLSEVMRERNAQLEYKKKRQEAVKSFDQRYIRIQKEV